MKEYRKVANFYYNDNKYVMLLDSSNKHFFLKTDEDNHMSYPTIFELIDLTTHFINIPMVMNIEKNNKRIKLIPKVLIGSSLFLLSSPVIFAGISIHNDQKKFNEVLKQVSSSEVSSETQRATDYLSVAGSDLDESKELEVDTYYENSVSGNISIYDMNFADKYFDYDNVSVDEVREEIKNGNNIPQKYKELLYDYCDGLEKNYNDIDLRVFYENLKTIQIVECTEDELLKTSWNINSCGCYVQKENKIYVLKDYEYQKGTWEYQVIMHEFSHALRSYYREEDGRKVRINFLGNNYNNLLTEEALNSLFAVSLFDYEERDVAYQLQSNYHSVIIDSMDNYSLSDYVNHSCSYYAKKLDEYTGEENKATTILELMEVQYDDFHDSKIYLEQSEYYPIYDYISNIYYKNRINADMSYEDAKLVADELVERVTYDVPEEYNIDINHFYDYFKEYCTEKGIKVKTR